MQDINRVVLIGRLTRDPELRKTQSGTSVCSFTLAVNRRQNQDGTQEADFINCVAWNKLADNIQLYQKKGNQLGIEGRINTRSYDNQQGQKVYVTEVIAENVQFLTPRNDFNEQNTLGVTNIPMVLKITLRINRMELRQGITINRMCSMHKA
ncbi:single-stranded DNA-binding protein [Holdemanella biformis]|uniref:single-stranded DNA-binding protein n=1 Tax=Holdemanella biformis TaxID=1735 RepID=UPI0039F4F016